MSVEANTIGWVAVGLSTISGWAVIGIEYIAQADVVPGGPGATSVPILSLFGCAVSGLVAILGKGAQLYFRGELIPKSLLRAVIREMLEEERTQIKVRQDRQSGQNRDT